MSQWMLGEIRLSKRVALKVEVECGGLLTPSELLAVARMLEWIARAARKWQGRVKDVTPAMTLGSPSATREG